MFLNCFFVGGHRIDRAENASLRPSFSTQLSSFVFSNSMATVGSPFMSVPALLVCFEYPRAPRLRSLLNL